MSKKKNKYFERISFNLDGALSIFGFALIRLSSIVISFLISWLVIKIYSAQDAGNYLYVYTLVGLVAAISSLGLNQTLVRFFGENGITQRSNQLLQTALIWCLTSAALSIFVLYVGSNYFATQIIHKPQVAGLIIASLLAVASLLISNLLGHAFQGNNKPLLCLLFVNILGNAILAVVLIVQYFGLIDGLSIFELARIYSLCCFASAISAVFIWYLQADAKLTALKFNNSELFSSAAPLWLSQLSTLILKHGPLIIAGIYIASSDIAKLSIVLRISELMNLLLIALTLVASPMYAKLWANKEFSQLIKLVKRNIRFLGLFGLIMGGAIFLLSNYVLGLFGEEYQDAKILLYIVVFGQVVYITFASNINLLVMSGHEKQIMFCTAMVCLISIPLMFLLMSEYEVLGAAVAASMSQILLVIGALLTVRFKLGFWAI